MADLTEIQASQSVKVAGSNSSGTEDNWLEVDINGYIGVRLYDASGSALTSQANGSQRALDIGINVLGVQIDPRSIRALTSADVVTANQGTSPWVISGTVTAAEDKNYGTVGASTLRTASQIGNATGSADFAAGNSSVQTLRVVIASNQVAIPVSQSGTWTTGRTWTLASGTDSVSSVQSGTWTVQPGNTANTTPWLVTDSSDGPVTPGTVAVKSSLIGGQFNTVLPTLTNGQQAAVQVDSSGRLFVNVINSSFSVTQGTSPWVVSGTVAISNFPSTIDTNYGTVGASTIRTASQIGNATGAAAFNAGTTTAQTLRVVLPTDQTAIPVSQSGTWTTGRTWTLASGTDSVSVVQSTSPWITKDQSDGPVTPGTAASFSQLAGGVYNTTPPTLTNGQQVALQLDSAGRLLVDANIIDTRDTNYGTVGANTLRSASQIGNATGAADFNAGNSSAQTLRVVVATNQSAIPVTGTFWQTTQPISGTVAVTQSTSPWVVSGTVGVSNFPSTVDTNYGTVGASTLRVASQIGNATGAAAFNAGTTTAQTLRVVLPTDQTAIPVSQSGTWTTGRTWTLASGTDSVAAVQSGTWTVQQGTPPWSVVGNIASGSSDSGNPVKVGAVFNTTLPTFTTGQRGDLQIDSRGRLIIVDSSLPSTVDTNYGTVGASTLRTASQVGNATGAADFNAGNSSAQTLRVVIASNQVAIPVSQSGTWTVQPGNTQNTTAWLTQDAADGPVTPGTVATKSILIGGQYNSSLPTLTTGQQSAIQVDSSGRLLVSGNFSAGVADKTTFTYGTTVFSNSGGVFQDTSPTLTAGQEGIVRLTSNRAFHVNLRDSSGNELLGQKAMAASVPVVLASDQTAIPVSQSGTWTVQQGTPPWTVVGNVASAATDSGNPVKIGGVFNTTLPTLTTGQRGDIQLDNRGRILTTISNLPATLDTNYGTVGASTLRTASQVGNATGAADFNAGATGAQTLRTVANQGAPNTVANSWPVEITDGTDVAHISVNNDLQVMDIINVSGQNRAQSVTTTAAEALGAATILSNRKFISITPTNGTVYWGFSNAVTTASGSPIAKNQTLVFAFGANVHIYLISAGTVDCRIGEGS